MQAINSTGYYDPYGTGYYTPLSPNNRDAMAQVLRSQWQDYLNFYQPIALRLMDQTSYNNPALITDQIAQGTNDVNTQFDTGQQSQGRMNSRYGVSPTQGQQVVMDRQSNLARSQAIVDAANNIRLRISDRNKMIAAGGVPNITSASIRTSVGTNGG